MRHTGTGHATDRGVRNLFFAVALLFAASCANPVGIEDGLVTGYWESGMTSVRANPGGLSIVDIGQWGHTDGPLDLSYGGKIDEQGELSLSSWDGVLQRRVRYTGTYDVHTRRLLLIITDSASNKHYFAQWLKPAPPPPPQPPPPPPP